MKAELLYSMCMALNCSVDQLVDAMASAGLVTIAEGMTLAYDAKRLSADCEACGTPREHLFAECTYCTTHDEAER